MRDSSLNHPSWRPFGVVLATGLCLLAGSTAGATAGPKDDGDKDTSGQISTHPLFPADDGPRPTRAQAKLGARITAIEVGNGEDPPKGRVPFQVDHGFLGISGSSVEGYTVILAKGVSPEHAISTTFAGLSQESLASLTLQPSDVTVEEITTVWRSVLSRSWVARPDVPHVTYMVRIQDARVVVHLSTDASDESRRRLAAISPLVRIVDIGPIRAWGARDR